MQNGDLSNALPLRVLVTSDVITDTYYDKKKIFGVIPTVKKREEYNRMVLSHLYLTTVKRGWTMELVSFTHDQNELDELMLFLDSYGTNPFRYDSAYKNVDTLVAELPYRPEVVGVVDTPDRLLRYGRWGMDFPSL